MGHRLLVFFLLLSAPTVHAGTPATGPTYGSSAFELAMPLTATNGRTFLTVWQSTADQPRTMASIADANGNVMTPVARTLLPDAALQCLFPNGEGYVAITTMNRIVFIAADGMTVTYGNRIAAVGDHRIAHAAFNGREFLVSDGFKAYLVTTAGETVQSFAFTDDGVSGSAADGLDFVVSVPFLRTITFGRIAGGALTFGSRATGGFDRMKIAIGTTTIAFANTTYAPRSVDYDHAYVNLFDRQGSFLASLDFDIRGSATAPFDFASSGQVYVFTAGNEAITIDELGSIVGRTSIGPASSIALNGARGFAAGSASSTSILGTSFTADRTGVHLGASTEVSRTERRQIEPRIASNGSDALINWEEQTGNGTDVVIEPVSLDAIPLDQIPVDIVSSSAGTLRSIAAGNWFYLVAWQDGGLVRARRITATGVLIDANAIEIGAGQISDQAIAFANGEFVVVWSGDHLVATHIVEIGGQSHSQTLRQSSNPARIVWDGRSFLVSWPVWSTDRRPIFPVVALAIGRINAGGVSEETRIPTTETGWRLASNGQGETVVVTDNGFPVYSGGGSPTSTVVAVHDGVDGLVVGRHTDFWTWRDWIASDVTWSGSDFVIAMRYGLHSTASAVATLRYSGGAFYDHRYTMAGKCDGGCTPVLVARENEIVVATSEKNANGNGRVILYGRDDMSPLPQPPALPTDATVIATAGPGQETVVRWQYSGPDVAGFAVENRYGSAVAVTGPESRSAAVSLISNEAYVRAFNAAGESDRVAARVVVAKRRAAGRP